MSAFLRQRWFLVVLASAIGTGLACGVWTPVFVSGVVRPVLNPGVRTGLVLLILFLMSVTLNAGRLGRAILSPGPVLWAVAVNAALMPLAAPLLMPLQLTSDFAIGVLIAVSVPSTMASASVWTRRAAGNDAIPLLVTMLTNGLCFLTTPFWLNLFAGAAIALDPWKMVEQLLLTALLPITLGQIARAVPAIARGADDFKSELGTIAQIGILLIVFESACGAGATVQSSERLGASLPGVVGLAVVVVSCIALHAAALYVAYFGAKLIRCPPADCIAVAFAASQKTLPIGVLIATDAQMFGRTFPWAVFPMLIYHAAQLFIDVAIADAFRARQSRAEETATAPAAAAEVTATHPPGETG